MARKKKTWLASLFKEPCARCGYTEIDDAPLPSNQAQSHPRVANRAPERPNVFPYAGPSARFQETTVLTPQASDSAMEEGLLIGSDFEGGYQTISRDDETVIEQPEGIAVTKGKGKGKKKVIASASTSFDGRKSQVHDKRGKHEEE